MQRRRIVAAVAVALVATSISFIAPVTDGPVAEAGVDIDGVLDIVFAQGSGDDNQECLGNGSGFGCAILDASGDPAGALDVAIGDIDADGDLDLVFAGNGDANAACLNDGTGYERRRFPAQGSRNGPNPRFRPDPDRQSDP